MFRCSENRKKNLSAEIKLKLPIVAAKQNDSTPDYIKRIFSLVFLCAKTCKFVKRIRAVSLVNLIYAPVGLYILCDQGASQLSNSAIDCKVKHSYPSTSLSSPAMFWYNFSLLTCLV